MYWNFAKFGQPQAIRSRCGGLTGFQGPYHVLNSNRRPLTAYAAFCTSQGLTVGRRRAPKKAVIRLLDGRHRGVFFRAVGGTSSKMW